MNTITTNGDLVMFSGQVDRVEVVDNTGRAYTKYFVENVYCQLQDDGKTLKMFVQYGEDEEICID